VNRKWFSVEQITSILKQGRDWHPEPRAVSAARDLRAEQLIRALTIIDLYTRKCLGIEIGFSLRVEHVVAAMNQLKCDRGLPSGPPATMVRSSPAD
jgi:transposase InsO family protein